MTITSDLIWAADINVAQPSAGKISSGFVCGDADPDIFNWLFNAYGQAAYDNQQAISSLANSMSESFGNAQQARETLGDRVTAVEEKTNIARRYVDNATPAKQGLVHLATALNQAGTGNDGYVWDTKAFLTFAAYYGSYFRLFQDDDTNYTNWENLTTSGTIEAGVRWISNAFNDPDSLKGEYMVTVEDTVAAGSRKFQMNFQTYTNFNSGAKTHIETKQSFFDDDDTGSFIGTTNGFNIRMIANYDDEQLIFDCITDDNTQSGRFQIILVERLKIASIRNGGIDYTGSRS